MKQCLHSYSKQASSPVQHFKNILLMTAWVEQQSEEVNLISVVFAPDNLFCFRSHRSGGVMWGDVG